MTIRAVIEFHPEPGDWAVATADLVMEQAEELLNDYMQDDWPARVVRVDRSAVHPGPAPR